MRAPLLLLTVAAPLLLAPCNKSGTGTSPRGPETPSATTPPDAGAEAPEPAEPPPQPATSQEELTALVAGNNAFAADLYEALRSEPGNLAFSPASVSTALAMTYAGARGQTEAEMKAVLRFELDQARLHPAFAELLGSWTRGAEAARYELAVANRLWGDSSSRFLSEYLTLTAERYGARLEALDFRGNPEAARQTINAWVEEQTRQRIKELLQPGIIGSQTRLVLTNAIYFKGTWVSAFEKKATKQGVFYAPGGRVKAQMMHQVGKLRAFEGAGLKALELSYEGDDLAMVFLLPDQRDGLSALEEKLSVERIQGWLGDLREQKVVVALPRFEVTSDFDLHTLLPELGMKTAFTADADFSGMNGARDLFISAVVHKAFVKVDEEGSEAAAATAVVVSKGGAARRPLQFVADHPFLFLIRDKRTGSILFLGRVSSPA